MITNFRLCGKVMFIKAEKDGIRKSYQISDAKFKSYNFTESEEYELDDKEVLKLKYDGVLVMAMVEELKELEDFSIASSILEIYLRNNSVKNVYDFIYTNNKNILYDSIIEGDYISYVDEERKELVVSRISKNLDNEDESNAYRLFELTSNMYYEDSFSSIDEIIDRFKDSLDFYILKVGGYDNMIPKESSWYAIYDQSYGDQMCSAYLSTEDGKYSMRCEFTDELYSEVTDTYDELIFNLLKEYKLVLPLRECMESM